MTEQAKGVPRDLVGVDLAEGSAWLAVEESVYPLEALYGAAYTFIDRCYVFIDRPEAGRYRVVLCPKAGPGDEAFLRALVGEFSNELLSCAWRHQITRDNRAVIESVTMQAVAGAMGPPSLDELSSFDFSDEPFDDPLGIAISWEEKYRKKESPPAKESGPAASAESASGQSESER